MIVLIRKLKWQLLYVIKHAFFLSGRSWNDFYGWMLDYQDRKLSLSEILRKKGPSNKYKGLWHWEKGPEYVQYMVKHGLKPDHVVFDLGCGYGRCTIPLLRFQTVGGKYIGSEISQRRIEIASEWINEEGLNNKNFDLILSKDESLAFLDDRSIDVTWVLSVFNHMPDITFEKTIEALGKKIKKGGLLFAYYANEDPYSKSVKFFPRSDKDMESCLSRHGFAVSMLEDWESEYEQRNRSPFVRMMLGTKV